MVGMADILLRVQEEKRFAVAVRADNQGTPETGRARGRITMDWNNPTGAADKLSITLQKSWRPNNSLFQAYDYERPLGIWGLKIGASASRNEFDVGGTFAAQGISAKTDNLGGFLQKQFIRSRQRNLSARIDMIRKDSITYRKGTDLNEDRLAVLSLEGDYDSVDTRFQGLNTATIKFSHGFDDLLGAMGSSLHATQKIAGKFPSRRGGSGRFASGRFNKITGNFTRLQSLSPLNDLFKLKNQWFNGQSLLLNAEIQWSPDKLAPLEQYSVGGPNNVRAYGVAEKLYDKALFYSVEYLTNAPFISEKEAFGGRTWGQLVQLSVFYDFAVGKNNDPLASQKSSYENFQGAGVGLRFNIPGLVSARITSSWAINERPSTPADPVTARHPQIWGDITFSY
jgi:hemolysin activation/secretion protein